MKIEFLMLTVFRNKYSLYFILLLRQCDEVNFQQIFIDFRVNNALTRVNNFLKNCYMAVYLKITFYLIRAECKSLKVNKTSLELRLFFPFLKSSPLQLRLLFKDKYLTRVITCFIFLFIYRDIQCIVISEKCDATTKIRITYMMNFKIRVCASSGCSPRKKINPANYVTFRKNKFCSLFCLLT